MEKFHQIDLAERDWGQILDGLEIRAESWKHTADYLRTGGMPDGETLLIEDCNHKEEADGLAACYEEIIKNIKRQRETQP